MSGGPVGPVVPVRMIAAMARNGVMGKDGKLPWSIPEDLVGRKELVFCEKTWQLIFSDTSLLVILLVVLNII